MIKRAIQAAVIFGFFVITAAVVLLLYATRPIAEEKSEIPRNPVVEVMAVRKKPHAIDVSTQGVAQPKRHARLAAELSGKVAWVSDNFVVGGQIKEGGEILRLETSNYDAALAQAKAQLAEAESALTAEKARADQARRDWSRLGQGQASDLTLRVPQIKSAQSRIEAARAGLEKAQLDLTKTVMKAPFDATVTSKGTEIGNFVAPGAPIGEFFQTSPLEVRLPLPLDELPFLETDASGKILGKLVLSTRLGSRIVSWSASIERTEGQVDQASRSIYLISEIDPNKNPLYSSQPIKLQPGLFLEATISGKTYNDVAKIPLRAFHDLNTVVVVDPDNKLVFRTVEVLRRSGDFAYVSEGLKENERVCLTELSTMVEGIDVEPVMVDIQQAGGDLPIQKKL